MLTVLTFAIVHRWTGVLVLAAALASCTAGPVGPLFNATSVDPARQQESCQVGSASYTAGSTVPGAGPCERCRCEGGAVSCDTLRCEPRPGCKALHRPDLCCPLYQCECELEGRVYGNGEKLVDPADPCRVCYCQGGEVVCRRIACFLRDDCRPRLVPGRCCPEYDNCPIRGVTALPALVATFSSISTLPDVISSPAPPTPKQNLKQEITIKEITPVSEIPVITDVKIKEILPSPNMEVVEYSSSKSPLIPREATSEKSINKEIDSKTESPVKVKVTSALSVSISELPPESGNKFNPSSIEITDQSVPSKISFSMQDNIKVKPTNAPTVSTTGSTVFSAALPAIKTTNIPVIEEEETSFLDHNPAFPPLPDDLSVSGNHDDEIDQNMDGAHISGDHEDGGNIVSSSKEPTTITVKPESISTPRVSESSSQLSTILLDKTTESSYSKQSPMLNLRSAISTQILDLPSSLPEEITGELDETTELSSVMTENKDSATTASQQVPNNRQSSSVPAFLISTSEKPTTGNSISQESVKQSTTSIVKSNVVTEVTSQTELSSLPIETSDQKPHATVDNDTHVVSFSTVQPLIIEVTSSKDTDVGTTAVSSRTDELAFEFAETTESSFSSADSLETTTDAVELIKGLPETKTNAAIVEHSHKRKNNVLTDLINIVGDVESISETTGQPKVVNHISSTTDISDSEELIPVNAGYKSKNSNWNVNSITETPLKTKVITSGNKQKVVEIDDDDSHITDSPPPNDKVEPTTRRPIIDNVSDDMPDNKTEKKDIEIITKSYVPVINRRPTKVIMKINNEKPVSDKVQTDEAPEPVSLEVGTTSSPDVFSSETEDSLLEFLSAAPSTAQ